MKYEIYINDMEKGDNFMNKKLECSKCKDTKNLIRFKKEFGLGFLPLDDESGELYCKRCYSNINGISRANLIFKKEEAVALYGEFEE